jgi:hypothetical protein
MIYLFKPALDTQNKISLGKQANPPPANGWSLPKEPQPDSVVRADIPTDCRHALIDLSYYRIKDL